ncbi:Tripartite-type tricarboxylate transporter, receptor component TctC [Anaerovirgula multivorans]|uniref:Tripartite-type tricarboxylate transporter, receptor component TctC n=1 Tax=Anaerovirgula multivorans TaxID=312168 RepID=A0A239GPC8_9FIRM|nr:tripartite tricarboxylate transporter substrate binding protein [Anaerovirgula multivorans]SNS70725.1 Tripartite-type tricarboxylate transporter, receptor component TctC [Anaerovirgula multivorans]
MKRYSKVFIVLLVVIFTLSSLVGCGSKDIEPTNTNPSEEAAQEEIKWPEKTIQMTVPYNAGGDTDIYARIAAKYLEKELGQTIVIINMAGASGMTAATKIMSDRPDGYNVLFKHTAGLITEATGLADFSYTEDFDIGGTIVEDSTYTVVVRKDSGFETLQDMVDYAKANPGKLTYSTVHGSVTHYVSVQLEKAAGIDIKELDVGSSNSDRIAAFLGKQVDVLTVNYATIKDYIESGDFIVMGILSEERVPTLPNVPTFVEQGYDVTAIKTYSYSFSKGTDPAIIEKFDEALGKISQNEEFQKEIESFFGVVKYMNPTETYNSEKEMIQYIKTVMEGAL